ncbi:MAG: sucrose-6-phosphate hydrolase [Eubacteriales bacterium]|nr:sucrose-6-phosphate hydrolase [Eubacteriales bacterium]
MFQYDFSNHQNRHIQLKDMPEEYYDRILKTTKEDPFYPLWHIAPKCGLMNDPNGLFEADGVHHIFYQWFPAGPVHGLKHWYHLTTKDFIHYEDRGVGMYPDRPFDDHGCYTGMALTDGGKTHIYYTGIEGEEQRPSTCHALFDGGRIAERSCILPADPELCTREYRDPFVFVRDGKYYMLTGAQDRNEKGRLFFYEGEDPERFSFRGCLDIGEYPFGYMLECPNYFERQDRGVLFFSPMGIEGENRYDFRNVFSVVYAVGEPLDTDAGSFSFERFYEMDKGFDFYAPQTYRDGQGRQLLFGWLGNSKSAYPTDGSNWAHMMTMPRELELEGDRLVQRPAKELEALKGEAVPVTDGGSLSLSGGCAFALEGAAGERFWIEIGNEAGECVRFSGDDLEFCLDRSRMTFLYAEKFGTKRYAKRLEGTQEIRLWADSSSLEIFADGGKTVFTSRMFLEKPSYVKVSGFAGTFWKLGPIDLVYGTAR